VWHLGDIAAPIRFSQVAQKASLRDCAVNLESDVEKCIRQGQARTAKLGRDCDQAGAQIVQQSLDLVLLLGLSFVVRRPALRIRLLGGGRHSALGHRRTTVYALFSVPHELCRIDVLAVLATSLPVRAGASRMFLPQADHVETGSALQSHVTRLSRIPPLLLGICNQRFTGSITTPASPWTFRIRSFKKPTILQSTI